MCDGNGEGNRPSGATSATRKTETTGMSELRKQLQIARDSHNKLRYSGDLAADVLAPRITWQRQLRIGISVATGIAAVLLLIIWLSRSSLAPQPQIAMVTPASQPDAQSPPSLAFTIERPSEDLSNMQFSPAGVGSFAPSSIERLPKANGPSSQASEPLRARVSDARVEGPGGPGNACNHAAWATR